jgi:NADPH2:quinone reductase
MNISEPQIGPGQVLVEVAVAGVNFMDNGVRQGHFWQEMPNPKTLGVEGAGRVLAVASDVKCFQAGQRVAWAYAPGSYAERVVIAADALVSIPDAIDDRTAASVMMQGLTAKHFATDFYPVQQGDYALVHAASGGVGMMLSQIIRLRGGTVIGRVSHQKKVDAAKAAGAEHVIVDAEGNFAEEVLRLTNGEGAHVVFDGSGSATFDGSIKSLRRSGTLCWFGPGLGMLPPIQIYTLPKSIKVGYAAFYDHVPTPELLRARTNEMFGWIMAGKLRVQIGATYALGEAASAHADMEARRHTGKLLLIP